VQRVKIFLKYGQVVEFDCKSLTTTNNGFGKLAKIEWHDADGKSIESLQMVNVEDIAAIVTREV
jgi:hypothetical protein